MIEQWFSGNVALVTGASGGIGAAIADGLVSRGATVITAQRGTSDTCNTIHADLTDPAKCERVISDLTNEHHRLDILINNAGMMTEASIDELSLSEWNQHVQLNLTAPFLLTKYALPWLKKSARKKGAAAIVNIGSIEGLGANPNHAAYCATKSGLHGLTRAIATDHGEDGIRCNAVAPGWIDTKLNLDFVAAMPDPEKFRQQIGEIHPLGRTGSTEEVAALVCWLASAQSSFVTGQIYTIDGGRMTKLSLPQ